MTLEETIKGIEIENTVSPKDLKRNIREISSDSRKVGDGDLFIAINGFDLDGHAYIGNAIEAGAIAVLYDNPDYTERIKDAGAIPLLTKESRHATPTVAGNFFKEPDKELNLVGITGTNGKTTIATLLYRLFRELGYSCGLLSTIANFIDDERFETTNTTQDPITIRRLLRRMADSGCQYCFMEVSSHSLHQGRVSGLEFHGAIFTNITHDHLDYHKTFREYIRCKKMLFDSLSKGSFALINTDDKNSRIMVQNSAACIKSYSVGNMADFRANIVESTIEGSLLRINDTEVWTRFIGEHNAHNLAAVYGAAILLGAKREEVLRIISNLGPVAGRLEYIKGGRGITAVIDYAHTPDALENILKTLKPLAEGSSLVVLFGCGGDRDRSKRSEMGGIAVKYGDRVVVTSDNPRSEDPLSIIEEIKRGIPPQMMNKCLFISDRREAIRTAVITAPTGSIVVLAGKGHENYQIINGIKNHFDDREEAEEALKSIQ